MKKYSPIELARLFEVHPNTIRLYERIGYIGKAIRKENNYREFTQKHVVQLKISRLVMAYPFTNQGIRNTGKAIIKAATEEKIEEARQLAKDYIDRIRLEIDMAKQTEAELKEWANGTEVPTKKKEEVRLTRKDIASWLHVTTEAVRNWERNELMHPRGRGANQEVYFLEEDKRRIRIIYMLRQCGYSMSAINKSMHLYDEGKAKEVTDALHADHVEELLSAGDNWITTLEQVLEAAMQIPDMIDQLENDKN